MNKKVVVIGHGMVGHRFVQVLRERDATDQWQVTVLGEEADAAYDRVALSSYIDSWDRIRWRSPETTTRKTRW